MKAISDIASCPRKSRRSGVGGYAVLFLILLAGVLIASPLQAHGEERCVLIELYFSEKNDAYAEALAAVEKVRAANQGITVVQRDVRNDAQNRERLDTILKHFRKPLTTTPVLYGCNAIICQASASDSWLDQLKKMLTLEVFVRTGCPHCAAARSWLPTLMKEYPGLRLTVRNLSMDAGSADRLSQLVRVHRTAAASVPVFHFCGQLLVGFQNEEVTGARLRSTLKRWTHVCQPESAPKQPQKQDPSTSFRLSGRTNIAGLEVTRRLECSARLLAPAAGGHVVGRRFVLTSGTLAAVPVRLSQQSTVEEDFALPLPEPEVAETPELDQALELPPVSDDGDLEPSESDIIELPLFGRLSVTTIGMPIFTIAVGLVDGFNPCAMWVLLFLLSILVNLRDRRRILAIAGTFVIISGVAYFLFMAAWLNVFTLIGYLRPIEVGLALLALLIGSVHVKDFFAFRKGVSFSIPESAKPGIYARVRRIVTAEHMAGAIVGAITLAIMVNVIELLCTAGLPALYTNILMQQDYPVPVRYAYLALYIAAYMFDDSLMVLAVVVTLSKRKLQESEGRWLKLVSGFAVMLLGVIMLIKPEWLH